MTRTAVVAALAATLLCAWVAVTPTDTLAAWLTHPVAAERQRVAVRAVTQEGAALWRVAAVVCACSWWAAAVLLCRLMRGTSPRAEPAPCGAPSAHAGGAVLLACTLLVVAGIVERATRIGESLWYDEISALIDYAQHGPGPILGTYFVPSNHVLHTLLSWCAITAADGVNEVILRVPAAVAGLCAIPAVAWLVHEYCAWMGRPSRMMTAAAAAAAALCPILVLESCEARGYSLMILCSAVSTASLLRGMRRSQAGPLLLCALATALGTWSHLVTAGLAVGQFVALIVWAIVHRADPSARRRAVAACAALMLGAVSAAALLAPLLPGLLRIRREFAALDGNEPTILGAEGLHLLLGVGGAWSVAALPAGALVALGLASSVRDRAARLPLALALLGLPIVALATEVGGSWMYARFGLFALPGCILALVLGAREAVRLCSRRAVDPSARQQRIAAALACAVAVPWVVHANTLPPKQPLRDAVELVRTKASADARIGTVGLADNVLAYYAVMHEVEIVPTGPGGADLARLPEDIDWVILLYPRSVDPAAKRELDNAWEEFRRLEGWVDWDNGDVLVYRRR